MPKTPTRTSPSHSARSAQRPRRVAFVIFEGFQPLDLTGPHEAFAMANDWQAAAGKTAAYSIEILAHAARSVQTRSGLRIGADRSFVGLRASFDTLLVAGGDAESVRAAGEDAALSKFLQRAAKHTRRVGSVCSGAFLLANAGLLEGRRTTTHWASAQLLARMYPNVEVDADAIWVRDGSFYSSAGVTAGIDLALALIEEDLGREAALAVARRMVVFLKRPGGQSQFSAELKAQASATGPLENLPEWIRANLGSDLGVEVLAAHVAMSPRNFARVFALQFADTPARYVEQARVERARRHLEDGRSSLDEIAESCGFGSVERMRRSFGRAVGVGPSAYRERFRTKSRKPGRRGQPVATTSSR